MTATVIGTTLQLPSCGGRQLGNSGGIADACTTPDCVQDSDPGRVGDAGAQDALSLLDARTEGGGGGDGEHPCHLCNVVELPIHANDIAVDARDAMIYATTPSTESPERANAVVAIPAGSKAPAWSAFVGSEPGPIALTDDASVLFVGLTGSRTIARFDVGPRRVLGAVDVGLDATFGDALVAGPLVPLPGANDVVAVSLKILGLSPDYAGVAVFDSTGRRPSVVSAERDTNLIVSGGGSTLFALNALDTGSDFATLRVSDAGVVEETAWKGACRFCTDARYAAGMVFAGDGKVIDPARAKIVGTFAAFGTLATDASRRRVYFLTADPYPDGALTLTAFDMDTFIAVAHVALPGVRGPANRLERWGTDGFVFLRSQFDSSGAKPEIVTFETDL